MKAKYLMLFLTLALIFNSVGCVKPEMIKVQYIVVAHKTGGWAYPEVTVSYNNDQRDTKTIHNLILRKDTDEIFRNLEESPKFSSVNSRVYWKGEIIATYNILKNEPLAIAAIGTNSKIDAVVVIIIVDGYIWKDGFCEGEGCAADASGLYDK